MKGRIPVLLALALALCSGFMPRRDAAPAPQPEASWPDTVKEAYLYTEGLKRLLIDGDTLAARGLLRRSLAADSCYAPAWYQLAAGGMYDHPDTAVGYARRAYELDTANKWYGRLYGQMLVRGERYDQARVLYRKLLRDDPRDPDNYRILAILYQQAGMPDSAVRLLDSAELRFGKIPLLVSLKRQLLVSTGQIDRALEEAKILAEAVPYEMENRLVLGELYSMVRADSLALAEFRAAVAIDSTSVPALASLAEYYNRRHEYRAYLGVVKRLFMLDGLPLQDKVSYFRQLTSDLRFYREYFFQVDELASTLLLRYPTDKEVVKLYGEHLIASGQLDRALAHYKLHLADRPPQLDYYTMVIDIESFNKHVDSVDRYVDRLSPCSPTIRSSTSGEGMCWPMPVVTTRRYAVTGSRCAAPTRTRCAASYGALSGTPITRWTRPPPRVRGSRNVAGTPLTRPTTGRSPTGAAMWGCSTITPTSSASRGGI